MKRLDEITPLWFALRDHHDRRRIATVETLTVAERFYDCEGFRSFYISMMAPPVASEDAKA